MAKASTATSTKDVASDSTEKPAAAADAETKTAPTGSVMVTAKPVKMRGHWCAGKFWPYVPAGQEPVPQEVSADLVERLKADQFLTDVQTV